MCSEAQTTPSSFCRVETRWTGSSHVLLYCVHTRDTQPEKPALHNTPSKCPSNGWLATIGCAIPTNTNQSSAGLMLSQRLRRWRNIKPALGRGFQWFLGWMQLISWSMCSPVIPLLYHCLYDVPPAGFYLLSNVIYLSFTIHQGVVLLELSIFTSL